MRREAAAFKGPFTPALPPGEWRKLQALASAAARDTPEGMR